MSSPTTSPTAALTAAALESWPKHRGEASRKVELRMLARRLRQRDLIRNVDRFRAWSHARLGSTPAAIGLLGAGSILVTVAGVTLGTTGIGF